MAPWAQRQRPCSKGAKVGTEESDVGGISWSDGSTHATDSDVESVATAGARHRYWCVPQQQPKQQRVWLVKGTRKFRHGQSHASRGLKGDGGGCIPRPHFG